MNKIIPEFDLYTGGQSKTPDFAVFYNLAYTNMEKLQKQLNNDIKYLVLAKYLWKANEDARNKSDGYVVTTADEKIIDQLITKLSEIRNYHSHIWHSNEALIFSLELKKFVENKFEKALASVYETNPKAVEEYNYMLSLQKNKKKHLFNTVNGKYLITEEGRVFFLSFFLTSGQMSRFLQQRKGSKRHDIPLYKVKHLLYKYYCHRDGASIADFNQEDSVLNAMNEQQKQDILKARQAYKIISYLYDYPHYLSDTNLTLLLPEDNEVRKVESVQDLQQFIDKYDLLPGFTFLPVAAKHKNTDHSKDEYIKNRTIAFLLDGIDTYTFHINFENLYKLVMLCLKYGNSKSDLLKTKLDILAQHREKLYGILTKPVYEWDNEDVAYLSDRANRDMRGYRPLTETAIGFFDNYDKERTKAIATQAIKLADMIRANNIPALSDTESADDGSAESTLPDPIIVFTHDFIETTEQKFRAENMFVPFAVQYLIDNKLTGGWYWEVETFTYNEKKKEFRQDIPDNYRLSVEDGHVTIGIPKTGENNLNTSGNERFKSFHQFQLGPRALKYLFTFHLLNKKTDIAPFLSQSLKSDMENLVNGEKEFILLEEQFLAQYQRSTKPQTSDPLEKIKKKIEFITQEWNKTLEQAQFLKRAEKNRVIMECYQFFDWPVDSKGQIKFLRANEYNQMSVCHYSLGAKDRKRHKPKWKYLYEDLFRLQFRKPAIPPEVVNMLETSENMDELLRNVIGDRQLYLENQVDQVGNLSAKKKKEHLAILGRKLGVGMPENWLNDEEVTALQQKRKHTLEALPFAVHPMLLLKYFEPGAYRENYTEQLGTPMQGNRIFERLRTPAFINGLCMEHYEVSFTDKIYLGRDIHAENKKYLSQKHKWIKAINNTLNEDAILWHIAQVYLKNNPYTGNMAASLATAKGKPELHVGNLYGQEIIIELRQGTSKRDKKDDTVTESLFTSVKMHQLDDIMFITDRERLRRAALHYRRRITVEKDFWETVSKVEEYTGTMNAPVPYELLRRELQLIAQHGIYLAGYLLDWERLILNHTATGGNKAARQQFLKTKSSKKQKGKYDYLNFDAVIQLYEENGNNTPPADLKSYRSHVLHSDIPVNGSFAWWARPESEIGKLLGVSEALNIPRDRTKYLQQTGE